MNSDYYADPAIARGYDTNIRSNRDIVVDDIPFYVQLARESAVQGLPVLELGCGTGRVTLPIAAARVDVTGLDASAAMLAVARAKATDPGNPVWVEGDMANFRLDRAFGLVIIPFRSFLLLLTVEQQLSCLRCIREHLVAGGRLALNFFNPDLLIMAQRLARKRSAFQRVAEDGPAQGGNTRRWEKTAYHTGSQSLDWTQRWDQLANTGAVIARVERNLRMRYIFRYEMEHLLARVGLTVEALYGWFDGRPFDDASSEMIWLARKPDPDRPALSENQNK